MGVVEINPLTVHVGIGSMWLKGLAVGMFLTLLPPLYKKVAPFSRALALLWVYALGYGIFLFEWPSLHFGEYTTAYQATAGQTFAEYLLIPLFAVFYFKLIRDYIWVLVLLSLACTWFHFAGLLPTGSMNTAFAAACLPLLVPGLRALVILTALTHHGSTALLIVAAYFVLSFVHSRKDSETGVFSLLLLLAASAFSAWCLSGKLFDGGERLMMYGKLMTFWTAEWKWVVFGMGPGTYLHTGLLVSRYRPPLFLQLHSDWLQLLWALGLVGLALALRGTWDAVKSARKNCEALQLLAGCSLFMVTYHPNQYFSSAILTAFAYLYAFNYRSS